MNTEIQSMRDLCDASAAYIIKTRHSLERKQKAYADARSAALTALRNMPALGNKPPGAPKTSLELAVDSAAREMRDTQALHERAQVDHDHACAELLAAENTIIARRREVLAREARAGSMEALAELRALCPHPHDVRRHQQFGLLPDSVRELVSGGVDDLNRPVSDLGGGLGTSLWEVARAAVLAAAENDSVSPCKAA